MAFISGTGSLLLNKSSTTEEINIYCFNRAATEELILYLEFCLPRYGNHNSLVIFSDIRSDILQHDERSLVVNGSRIKICPEEGQLNYCDVFKVL